MTSLSSRLAIFDLDGTLLQTSHVDDDCYARALRQEFGIADMSTDWGSYSHSTDRAILGDLIQAHTGRPATDEDCDRHRHAFVELLRIEARERPQRFAPTPGAAAALAALPTRAWKVALATGGWERSARLKLATAGLSLDGIPAAFADDALPREEIIDLAASRALGPVEHVRNASNVVYIGDGLWDLRAARRLGIGFVGIARDERAARLREAGAADVLPDLLDVDALLNALQRASHFTRAV